MTRSEIKKRLAHWIAALGLVNWNIKFAFGDHEHNGTKLHYDTLASTNSDPKYLWARIVFNKRRLPDIDDETIVHELLHCFHSEVSGFAKANLKKDCHQRLSYVVERFISEQAAIIVRASKKK